MVNVVFCGDRGTLIGLHTAVRSMLEFAMRPDDLRLFFLVSDFTSGDKAAIKRTVDLSGSSPTLAFVDFDREKIEKLPKFRGGQMTYARLYIASLLEIPRCIYLDYDLIVQADVCELYDYPLGDAIVGAVSWFNRNNALEKEEFRLLGMPLDLPYYNAGVLVMDLDRFRESQWLDRIFADQSGRKVSAPAADQSFLNYHMTEQITPLPRRFNTIIAPNRRRVPDEELTGRIIHFQGSPKPWSTLGQIHGHNDLFIRWLSRTSVREFSRASLLSRKGFSEIARSPRAYLKALHKK